MQFLYSSLSDEDYVPWLSAHIVSKYKDVQVTPRPSGPKGRGNYWFYMGMLLMFTGCFIVPFVYKMFIT